MCGGGREEAVEEEPGIQNQKQEPHTKMWGMILGRPIFSKPAIHLPLDGPFWGAVFQKNKNCAW